LYKRLLLPIPSINALGEFVAQNIISINKLFERQQEKHLGLLVVGCQINILNPTQSYKLALLSPSYLILLSKSIHKI